MKDVGVAGLAGTGRAVIFAGKTLGEVLKRLLTTDFGTARGLETDSSVERKIDQGYQKGLKQAA